ncbi:MAG: TonB family protein [Bacteroidota bacterium]
MSHNIHAQEIYPQQKGKRYVYVDGGGKLILKTKFKDADYFHNGLAAVSDGNKWGFIDKNGRVVVPLEYDKVHSFFSSVTFVQKGEQYWLIDNTGKQVSNIYDEITTVRGQFVFMKQHLWGLMDSVGQVITPAKFEALGTYYNRSYTVKLDGKWHSFENGTLNDDESKLYFTSPEERPLYMKYCLSKQNEEQRRDCSEMAAAKALYKNLDYPLAARQRDIEGMVVLQFVIGSDGRISDIEIVRSIGGGCDAEAMRVVSEYLNKWEVPGHQDGIPINTVYILPVKFRLI